MENAASIDPRDAAAACADAADIDRRKTGEMAGDRCPDPQFTVSGIWRSRTTLTSKVVPPVSATIRSRSSCSSCRYARAATSAIDGPELTR